MRLMQPGGEPLTVSEAGDGPGRGWSAWVGGPVRLLARGEVFVEALHEGRP